MPAVVNERTRALKIPKAVQESLFDFLEASGRPCRCLSLLCGHSCRRTFYSETWQRLFFFCPKETSLVKATYCSPHPDQACGFSRLTSTRCVQDRRNAFSRHSSAVCCDGEVAGLLLGRTLTSACSVHAGSVVLAQLRRSKVRVFPRSTLQTVNTRLAK